MKLTAPWYCALLVLFIVKPSHQEYAETSNEDISNSIQLLTSLFQDKFAQIDSKLTNFDSKLTDFNSKLTNLDSEFIKMNARLELESVKANSKLSGMNSTLVEVKDELALVKEYVQSVEGGLATLGERASRSLQLSEITKSLNEQHYNEDKIIKETISENIQTIKNKIIYLHENGLDVNSNETELDNKTSSLLKIIKQRTDSLKTHLYEIKSQEDEWRETLNEIRSLGSNSSEDIKWAIQEANLCNSAINSLISRNFIMSNNLATINNNINKFVNESILVLSNPIEISVFIGQEASIDCGIHGEHNSCFWEHDNSIYKLDDISLGSHPGMKATTPKSLSNRCGITISSVSWSHDGKWTCKAHTTSGHVLSATKTLSIKSIPYGFEKFNGRNILVTKLSHGRMTFHESVNRCRMMNAKPFIPYSQKEFNFIVRVKRNLNNGDIWVPANDIDTEADLKWTDSTDAPRSPDLKWCNGQRIHMNSDTYDCAILGYSGCPDSVRMIGCSWRAFPMICEI